MLLLDTHVWIWLASGDKLAMRISKLVDSAAKAGTLVVSAISVWEVAMLDAKHRIRLQTECADWVARALNARGLSLSPLTPEILVASTRLPGFFHSDPADCIIVATARHLGATILTNDRAILRYAKTGSVLAKAV